MDPEGDRPEDWPLEDDDDALNDETFGDGEEYNWEAGHELLNDINKPKPNGKEKESKLNESFESGVAENYAAHPFEKEDLKPDGVEDDFDNENALEESMWKLVMDDLEDDDEEETMKPKLRRLGLGTNLNTYFMPPQVASKHLQWFMDKELPGGSSLLGSSVWSMHPTTTPSDPPTAVQTHHPTSNAHADSINSQIRHVTNQIRSDNIRGKLADSNAKDKLAPNLNNVIGLKSNSSHQPTKAAHLKPVFKTLEEIERELLEGNAPSTGSKTDHVDNKTGANSRPKILTAEEVERELIQSSTPSPKHIHEMPTTPINLIHHLNQIHRGSPEQVLRPHMMAGSLPPVGSPSRPPPGMNLNMPPMMMQRMPQNPQNAAQMIHNNTMLARRMMPPNVGIQYQLPPNIAAQIAYQQQQHQLRMLPPHLRGSMPLIMPFPQFVHPMRHGFPGQPVNHGMPSSPGNSGFMRLPRSDDPYRGLMNEKDKQRLRNIQIIQLQNDHPYTTDYYCLMYKVRHGVSDPKRQRDFLEKLFPKKSDEGSGRNNYQPAHFENSLGKLQAVSALAPKKAIDTVIRVVDSGPSNRSGMKAYRYLLLEVEKLYECLLKIQEADIRKTLLLNADEGVIGFRGENTDKVVKVLRSSEKLSEILCVQKGKMLVSRLIPLMEPSVRYFVFAHMIRSFPSWAMVNISENEKTYPFLRHCIFAADMSHLTFIISSNDVVRGIYDCMTTSKLGVSLLMAAFHRAECIISETLPELSENLVSLWVKNSRLALVSMVVNIKNLATPMEISPNILHHFGRFRLPPEDSHALGARIRSWADNSIPLIQ